MIDTNIFGSPNVKLNSKWAIGSFLAEGSTKYQRRNSTGLTDRDVSNLSEASMLELDRALKEIDSTTARLGFDYDKLYKELTQDKLELKQEIQELKAVAKPEAIAMLKNGVISIANSQIRIIELKQKLYESKFKNKRDEHKLLIDKNKANGVANSDNNGNNVQVQVTNSPASIGSYVGKGTSSAAEVTYDITPSRTTQAAAIPDNFIQIPESKTVVETPILQAGTEQFLKTVTNVVKEPEHVQAVSSTNIPNGDMPVLPVGLTGESVTVSDIVNEGQALAAQRRANRDTMLDKSETLMGFDLKHSLDGMISREVEIHEKAYINPEDGTYYVLGYKRNANGELVIAPEYNMQSVTHIGNITVDTLQHTVVREYYDNPIPYEVVDNDMDMPVFYRNEWNSSKTDKFRLDEEMCLKIKG